MSDIIRHPYNNIDQTHGNLKRHGLIIVTAYITLLFVFSIGDRFSFTKTIWDNVISDSLRSISIPIGFQGLVFLLGIPVLAYMSYLIRKSFFCLDTALICIYLLVMILSALFDPEVEMIKNLQAIFYLSEPLIICYYVSRLLDYNGWRFLLFHSLRISVYLWGVGCTVSVAYYFMNYSSVYHFGNVPLTNHQGIVSGRLFGAFSDPNYASIVCILLTLCCFYILSEYTINRVNKIIIYICLVLFVLYIVLAFSRTALVSIIAFIFVFSFYRTLFLHRELSLHRIIVFSLARFIVYLILLALVYYLIRFLCQSIVKIYMPGRENDLVSRIALNSSDISGGRFEIWYDYFIAFLDRPFFGFSANGAFDYICNQYPWSTVAIVGWFHTHNTYIQVLCQGGIIGFISIFTVILTPLIRFIKKVLVNRQIHHPKYIYLFFAISICVLASGISYSSGFNQIRIEADLFWISIGGVFVYLNRYVDKHENYCVEKHKKG